MIGKTVDEASRARQVGPLSSPEQCSPRLASEHARRGTFARTSGDMPLLDALKLRRSTREYFEQLLRPHVLSDLPWAVNGVNRPSDLRTAPYWRHIW
jgi:hypothetical protein